MYQKHRSRRQRPVLSKNGQTKVQKQALRREQDQYTRRELRHKLGTRRTRRSDVKASGEERPRVRLARLIKQYGIID